MTRETKSISGSADAPVVTLTWSQVIGKRVREGPWADQAVSTTRKFYEALDAAQLELAAQLVDYFMEEAKVVYLIYDVWGEGFRSWLLEQGIDELQLSELDRRLSRLLAFPDGSDYERRGKWAAMASSAGTLAHLLRTYEFAPDEARRRFDDLRESWRQLHDRSVDYISGLLTFIAEQFGEDAIEKCYRHVLDPYLQERYAPFDVRRQPYEETIYRNLYLTFEAMRAHLCGPERTGDLQFTEYEDRYVIAFDPCGSGNRSLRGDAIEHTGPRPAPPYNFGVTKDRHDWAWNEEGICYYCAHCCFALERWPAEQWGHPLRVVDSPRYPEETQGDEPKRCTWTIYKSIEAIPESAYHRIGLEKPSKDVSR
jgi:hypothetical protein